MAEPIRSAYQAAAGFEAVLAEELALLGARVAFWHGALAISPDPPVKALWSLNTWLAPVAYEVASIGEAAAVLRGLQRNWGAYAVAQHRRMALITAKLPVLRPKPLVFPAAAPAGHLGAWTLLEDGRLLASPVQSSPWVNGAALFVEDRAGPPSRAYLKLWEALARLGVWPGADEVCMDLGAAPGGWSWVLARLGARVVAVDKAKLDPAVASLDNVAVRQESAFGIDPDSAPDLDWLFSDVIAYPARMLALVQRWIAHGRVKHIICTLKFQGQTDHATAAAFAAIPGGRVWHLFHNKHELTFVWQKEPGLGIGVGSMTV